MLTEQKCPHKNFVSHTMTDDGKKQRFRCKDCGVTFVTSDGREKKVNSKEKFLILLLAQVRQTLSLSQIGVLFKMRKQSVDKIIRNFWRKAETGIQMEVDLEDMSCDIFSQEEVKNTIGREIDAHNKSDWMFLNLPFGEGKGDAYLLKALKGGDRAWDGNKKEERRIRNDFTDNENKLFRFASVLGNTHRMMILKILLQKGSCNRVYINKVMRIPSFDLKRNLGILLDAGLIYKTTDTPIVYAINWEGIKSFEEMLGRVFTKPEQISHSTTGVAAVNQKGKGRLDNAASYES